MSLKSIAIFVSFVLATAQAAEPSNFVSFRGKKFATLDDISPYSKEQLCQTGHLSLPSGWTIATNDAFARAAIWAFPWGTGALVLDDGSAWATSGDALAENNALSRLEDGRFGVTGCTLSKRILITAVDRSYRHPFEDPIASIGVEYMDAWDAFKVTSIGEPDACSSIAELPIGGWRIAADTDQTVYFLRAAFAYFDATCLFLDSGRSIDQTLSTCPDVPLKRFTMGAVSLAAHQGCGYKVLLQNNIPMD